MQLCASCPFQFAPALPCIGHLVYVQQQHVLICTWRRQMVATAGELPVLSSSVGSVPAIEAIGC